MAPFGPSCPGPAGGQQVPFLQCCALSEICVVWRAPPQLSLGLPWAFVLVFNPRQHLRPAANSLSLPATTSESDRRALQLPNLHSGVLATCADWLLYAAQAGDAGVVHHRCVFHLLCLCRFVVSTDLDRFNLRQLGVGPEVATAHMSYVKEAMINRTDNLAAYKVLHYGLTQEND